MKNEMVLEDIDCELMDQRELAECNAGLTIPVNPWVAAGVMIAWEIVWNPTIHWEAAKKGFNDGRKS
jgi:hypothetical protein